MPTLRCTPIRALNLSLVFRLAAFDHQINLDRYIARAWRSSRALAEAIRIPLVDPCGRACSKDSTRYWHPKTWNGGKPRRFAGSQCTAQMNNGLRQLRPSGEIERSMLHASLRQRDKAERVMVRVATEECHKPGNGVAYAHPEHSFVETLLLS
jgi:hypothetical protein